ncbi:MAG: glycosyltransferase family 9 protein [Proteobacteria bacterium]|nr:glycosyltransferase family 9 protein [Pseudomonadota bacterium]HQR04142.1 glycosyltransferase family 9 protein [Rhodocyclaceae bacterium]
MHPRILVVRRDNIGDLVCTTPLLHCLRESFPDAFIGVLANSYNASILDGNPDVDAVYVYGKGKHQPGWRARLHALAVRIGLILRLRRSGFDWAILAKSGFDRHGLRMARLAGARRIVGFAAAHAAPGLTDPLPPPDNERLHEVEAIAGLLQPLGVDTRAGPLQVYPDPDLQAAARARLTVAGANRRWIALHISARESGRRWPAEKFTALIEQLENSTTGIALFWSPGAEEHRTHPGDDGKAGTILAACGGRCVVPFPTATLPELTAALGCCNLFIGADGGAMHLAAATGLPVVALFENIGHKKHHWYPWQVPHRLVFASTQDVAGITVNAVAEATTTLLHVTEARTSD